MLKNIEKLEGYFVDYEFGRTIHVTFEDEDVIVFDIYDDREIKDTLRKDPIGIIKLNIRTGRCRDRLKEGEVSQSPPNKLGGLCREAQGQLVDQEAFMEGEKQQLGRRDTYTPAGAAPARGNCDPALNREKTLSVPDSKTLPNNSEEHLTDLSMSGVLSRLARIKLLMPLRGEKAIIVERARGKIEEVRRGEFPHPTSRVVSFA